MTMPTREAIREVLDNGTAEDWGEMLRRIADALEAQGGPVTKDVCVWSEDDKGNWDTGCGNLFVLNDGTPYDNEMGFCCYCGHKIDQVAEAD